MSGNVGYATLQVIASMKGVAAGVQKELGASSPVAKKAGEKAGKDYGNGMSGAAKTAIKALAGTVVAEKAFDFFKDSVKDADAYRKVANLTAAAIKSTGGAAGVSAKEVAEMSEKLGLQDGISQGVAQSTANMVLHYNAIKNVGADKVFDKTTQAALNLSAATGVSAAGAAKQLGKALQSPATSLSALTRSGITFTAAQAKQIQAMAKSGNLLGAQDAILKQVNTSYGGAAAAAATPMAKMRNVVNELQLAIGKALIPVLDKLANIGITAFTWAQDHITVVKILAVAVGVLVAAMAVNKIMKWVQAAKESAVVTKAWAAAQWLFNAAMDANPIVLIVTGIVALGAALVIAYEKSATFRAIVQAAFKIVKTVAMDVVNFFTKSIPKAFDAVKNVAATVLKWIKTNWPLIAQILISIFVPGGVIVVAILHFKTQILGFFTDLWDGIVSGLTTAWNAVTGAIATAVTFVTGIASRFAKAGAAVWNFFLDTLHVEYNAVKTVFLGVVGFVTGIPGRIAKAGAAVWNFFLATLRVEYDGVKTLFTDAVSFVAGLGGRLSRGAGKIWGFVESGLSTAFTWVKTEFGNVVTFVEGLPGKIASAASGMWDGFKDAFRDAIDWIIDGWNSIKFKLPSINTHIPGIGKIGGSTIGVPQIPRLAKGGMTTGQMTAVIGDNRSGNEVVMPMDSSRTVSALSAALAKAGASHGGVHVAAGAIQVNDTSGNPVSTASKTVRRIAALGKA